MAKHEERFMVTVLDEDHMNKPIAIYVRASSTAELMDKVRRMGWPTIQSVEVCNE